MICSPSFLSCDFDKLESEIRSVSQAKWLHFDVMDGDFVENTTYDHKVVSRIKKISNQFFDCHLMISKPENHFLDYILAGADLITFHLEATQHPKKLIESIKNRGVKAGISIKPDTEISSLEHLLADVDLVLIMSVEPGKGGQKFIEKSLEKIKYLNDKRNELHYNFLIEVDGGINFQTAKKVKDAGNDIVVVGSFIFNKENRNEVIRGIENV